MEDEKNKVVEPLELYRDNYTYADYLKFDFDYMVELIRGKIFKMSPAQKATHQKVLLNFSVGIATFLKKKSCEVFIAPYDVVLPVQNRKKKEAANTVVQPDLCVICDLEKLDEAGCFGAPDWIIEIISPHTSKKDLTLKYEVYEEAGVTEYWIVLPKDKIVEIYLLKNGKYQRMDIYTEEESVSSYTLPELSIDLREVFDY